MRLHIGGLAVGEQTIFRIARDREHPFTSVPNALAQDKSLTYEARGLLLYLLSKPDDWVVRMHDLELAAPKTGEEKVRRIVKELLDAGYLERITSHDENGHFHTETMVYEHRRTAAAVDGSTVYGKAGDGKAVPLLINELQNNIEEGVPSSPRKRAARVRDPRLDTPAMRCVFSVVKHYPHNGLLDKVIAVLGENPNRARLQACYEAWLAKGWNPKAWTWLTEWYVAGGPPKYASGNGCSASPDPPPKPKPSGPVVILNPLTGKREVIDGNGSTAGRESTSSR
jgi:hypothetical protein